MRELRRAAKEGPRAFLTSASRLPHRHPWMLGSSIGALAIILLAIPLLDTRRDVQVLAPQVTEIVREAEACRADATQRELRSCVRRIEIALRRCQRSASCRARFLELVDVSRERRGGDALLPPSTGGEQPAPPRGGGRGTARGTPGGTRKPTGKSPKPGKAPPQANPQPAPVDTTPDIFTPPQPGKSGDTPGAGKGTRACVDLIVSACVRAPSLLP